MKRMALLLGLLFLFGTAAAPAWAQGPPTTITVGEPFGITWDYLSFSPTVRGCNDAADLNCISGFKLWDITGGVKVFLATSPAPAGATTPVTGLQEIISSSNNQDVGLRKFVATTVLRTEIGDFESVDSVEARAVSVPLPPDAVRVQRVP